VVEFGAKSLRERFAYNLVIGISIVTVLFSVIIITATGTRLDDELNIRLVNLIEQSEISLSNALWQFNTEYVDDYVEALFNYDDVVYVRVSNNVEILKEKALKKFFDKKLVFFQMSEDFIDKQSEIRYQNVVVGTVSIVLTREKLFNHVMMDSIILILLLLLTIAIVFTINHKVSNRYLFIPLHELENSVRSIAEGNMDTPIVITSNDEIGHLAKSFEQMMQNLKIVTASRDELNHEIRWRKQEEHLQRVQISFSDYAAGNTLQKLLQKILDEAEALTRSKIGLFHFVADDQETLLIQTWSTNTLENLCEGKREGNHHPISEAGVWVDCFHQRQPVVHNDYAGLPHKKGLPEGHPSLSRELVVPIIRGDKIVAILGVGNKETAYDRQDVDAVQRLLDVTWEIVVRKLAEEELLTHHEHLADMVAARTTQLSDRILEAEGLNSAMANVMDDLQTSNRDLEAAMSELQASNRELDAFSYSVSHDLRAPLRHIAGFVKILMTSSAGSLDETGRRHLDIVAESTDRMGKLIDGLLEFSRTGRVELRKKELDLYDLVQDVVQEMDDRLQDREINWDVAELPQVHADYTTLRMVLVNLLENAVKYTRNREQSSIEIGTFPSDKEGVVVFVRDNGVGFNMRYADKLFGVFQRLHRAEEFEGTGVGLANVQRIIQRHGGRVWAEAEVDKGATFYFSLPTVQQGGGLDVA